MQYRVQPGVHGPVKHHVQHRVQLRPYTAVLPLARASLALVLVACVPIAGTTPAVTAPPVAEAPVPAPWIAPLPAAVERSEGDVLDRLQRMADVWHTARWFHPDLVDRVGAWDTAYMRHVEAVRSATDDAGFARALDMMLREIGDAETRVVRDTVVISGPLSTADVSAAGAVLDLRRGAAGEGAPVLSRAALNVFELPAFSGSLVSPVRRRIRRVAPTTRDTFTRDAYPRDAATPDAATLGAATPDRDTNSVVVECCSHWTLQSGPTYRGQRADSTTSLTVLVDDHTLIPAPLYSLHHAGRVRFVSSGTGALHSDAAAVYIPIGDNMFARVRVEQLLLENGAPIPTRADSVVAPTTGDASHTSSTVRVSGLGVSERQPAAHASGAAYPSLPERLFAVSKLWGTVRAFNPYLPMADESWDEMFARAIGEVETATTARAYSTAIVRFAAALNASQVNVVVPDHPEFGSREGTVPFRIRLVDRRAIVSEISDAAAAQLSVFRGDEIVAIGGEPIDKRLDRLREYVSASNDWSRDALLEQWLLSGPAGVTSTFRVQSASGAASNLELRYEPRDSALASAAPRRDVQTLANGVVLVRLGATENATALALPDDVARASAVIVDARGVRGAESVSWLAGSLLDADDRAYARDDVSEIVAPPRGALRNPEIDPARQFTRTERRTPRVRGELFAGPMAILVDASTSGEGELLVLRLAAGAGRRVIVGATTAGAVGNNTTLSVPGGVRITIPVSDVRYPDGRFIQRLGVSPSIRAEPTVVGVRSGRDEVLEAAQRWITQQLAPPAPVRRRE